MEKKAIKNDLARLAQDSKSKKELQLVEEKLDEIGDIFNIQLKSYNKALSYYMRCFDIHRLIYPKSNVKTAKLLCRIGCVHIHLENYDEAMKYSKESLEMFKKVEPTCELWISQVYYNIASILYLKRKYEEATPFFQKALEIFKRILDKASLAMILYNAATNYLRLKKYNVAIDYYTQSLELKKTLLPLDHFDLSRCLFHIGDAQCFLGKHEEGLEFLKLSLEERKQIDSEKYPSVEDINRSIEIINKKIGRTYKDTSKYIRDDGKQSEDSLQTQSKEKNEKIEEVDGFIFVEALNEIDFI